MNNRRAFLSSLAGTILIAAGPARALICDERSARTGGIRTQSYTCRLGGNRALTATFLRMSDVVTDNISGTGLLPGGYNALLANGRMIDTPVSRVLDGLQRDYAFAFEPFGMEITFDGLETGGGSPTTACPAVLREIRVPAQKLGAILTAICRYLGSAGDTLKHTQSTAAERTLLDCYARMAHDQRCKR